MPELSAIFFDIDDTLYSTTEFAVQARRNSVNAMIRAGLRMDPQECLRELNEVIGEFSSNYEHHFDKLLLRIPQKCYDGINPGILIASAVVSYHDTKVQQLVPFPNVPEVLERLSQTDLILGVITDGRGIKQAEKLVRLRVLEYLTPTAIFISDQIGISKPNAKLYQKACQDMGLDPRKVLYVGDNPKNDIDPANRVGMTTVWFKGGGRHTREQGETRAVYEIQDFMELLDIVNGKFGIKTSDWIKTTAKRLAGTILPK